MKITGFTTGNSLLVALTLSVSALVGGAASAQTYSGSGQNWSAGWGFQSATDRSVNLQAAQAVRAARNGGGPQTVVNTTNYTTSNTYSNSNFVEYSGAHGQDMSTTIHVGDAIDQNTNSIGAMNTGQTEINVNGNNNAVNATNAADSNGCVDGSITTAQFSNQVQPGSFAGSGLPGLSALGGVQYTGPSSSMACK